MVLASCSSLQLGAALAAHLFDSTGSTGATLLRLGLAALILLVAVRPRVRKWEARQWRAIAVLGVSMAGMNGFFYAAIDRIPLGTAVTIEFLGPLALAAVLTHRARDLAWVLLAGIGVVLLWAGSEGLDGEGLDPVGVVLVLVAAVFWAGYILASARVGAAVPGHGGLAVAVAIGALVLLPAGAHGASAAFTQPDLLLLAAGTGLLASVIPYSLELAALRRLPKSLFGVLLSLEPVVAVLAGWVLLSQGMRPLEAVAVAVVVAASVGSTLSARPAPAERSPEPARTPDPVLPG
ncbi:EamA family transporter [Motilibacter sp. E257]|uniref:EamA family transporter n=2 Tax=Motilibacter deserti TaxID=2714956 RepID=A0ABX0GRR8_9ACTN|nr:EamA family transporter [Motilibacter deserti]